jgi:Cof subfamily protein (haloacid dehalogenase superfamily)
MPIRLIALDIDGTLLDSRGVVPAANQGAIASAVARGIDVVLVTGRRFDFALPVAFGLPERLTFIVNNGALVRTRQGRTEARRLLPRKVAREVLRRTPEFRGRAAVVFDRPREGQIICEKVDWHDPLNGAYYRRNREYVAEMAPLEACLTEDPLHLVYTGPVAQMRVLAAQLDGHRPPLAFGMALTEYAGRDFSLIDIMRHGCSKGLALEEWAAARRIPLSEVMAVGDNLNDQEMLAVAGLPIVMGNGVPELMARGWTTTGTNDEAGVAQAIERYALATLES